MANRSVALYTGEVGFKNFIDGEECTAKLRKEEKWDIQIVVPTEFVQYTINPKDPDQNLNDTVLVCGICHAPGKREDGKPIRRILNSK